MKEDVTLVTGASGFLGRATMKLLEKNEHRAIGLDPRPSTTTQVLDDLSDRSKLKTLLVDEKITRIVHAGGVSGPMVMADDPIGVMGINVIGSLNLLFAAIEAGVKTFIYCSSVSAIGNFYEKEPIGEDYLLRPTSAYGASKAAMDMVLRGLWRKVALDLCSLRFTVIYGPGRQTVFTLERIIGAALAGQAVQIEATTDWPYVYIDDAAQAAVSACFSAGRKQLSYFIAHPEMVTLDDMAAAAAAAGKPVSIEVDNSKPAAARGPVDTEAAARDFGFRAKVGHREGIRRVIEAER
ncbi:MAG TPA: NAD(P)-dependent oxidoreductase [Pseudolabrys sp.]|nr:NAD(P)-dependent oxidoreductase [Pseudolabrys sp.]